VRVAYTGAVSDRKGLFELAHRGTLFYDELQITPLEVQKQLLMVLQARKVRPLGAAREVEVDVKLVAASNGSLAQAVAEQRCRADLYMRLSPATRVTIPPLRARRADLLFFSQRFVERATDDPDLRRLRERLNGSGARTLRLRVESAPAEPLQRAPAKELSSSSSSPLELILPASAWQRLESHPWPGNLRELAMLMHNLVAFTLVRACDALDSGVPLRSSRLQIDPGLVGELLAATAGAAGPNQPPSAAASPTDQRVRLKPAKTLNAVARGVERQYLLGLFEQTSGDFARMAGILLGDPRRERALRLRFNQLGIRIRQLRRP